jgi:hypothetical protein
MVSLSKCHSSTQINLLCQAVHQKEHMLVYLERPYKRKKLIFSLREQSDASIFAIK